MTVQKQSTASSLHYLTSPLHYRRTIPSQPPPLHLNIMILWFQISKIVLLTSVHCFFPFPLPICNSPLLASSHPENLFLLPQVSTIPKQTTLFKIIWLFCLLHLSLDLNFIKPKRMSTMTKSIRVLKMNYVDYIYNLWSALNFPRYLWLTWIIKQQFIQINPADLKFIANIEPKA